MKYKILSFFIVISCVSAIYAQDDYSLKFGRLTQHEVDMTEYELDKEAEAVVLYEMGEYYFRGDAATGKFMLYMDKKMKTKILTQAGLKYANIEIPYYQADYKYETVYIRSATTYNYENGQLLKNELDTKNIFREKINENWYLLKFSMPNVKEGSIIEIDFQIVSPFLFNLHDWEFQHGIPVIYSNLEVRVIPYYDYAFIMKGSEKFDERSDEVLPAEHRWGNLLYKEMQVKMGMKNIPAFRDEEFITSPNDYKATVQFQLACVHFPRGGKKDIMTTWQAMCNDFLKHESFGKFIEKAEKTAKKILPTLHLEDKTQTDKIKIITQYVKSNYNWNGITTKFAFKKFNQILTDKSGNSAELNLFLLACLRAANIEARPVVLSTREHGKIANNYPFQHYFNYVLAAVQTDSAMLFLDATEPMLAYNELPTRCINVQALVVEKNTEKWLTVEQNEVTHTEKEFIISFDENSNSQKTAIN